jgi:hypothetical protein
MEGQFNIQNLVGETLVTLYYYPEENKECNAVLKVRDASVTLEAEQLKQLAYACHLISAIEEIELSEEDAEPQEEGLTFNESAFY